jgi:hypothetical protein
MPWKLLPSRFLKMMAIIRGDSQYAESPRILFFEIGEFNMGKDVYWWEEDLGIPRISASGQRSDEKRVPILTTEWLYRDVPIEKRIGPCTEKEWTKQTTTWLTVEFEHIYKFLGKTL